MQIFLETERLLLRQFTLDDIMEKAGLTLETRYWYKGTLEAVKYALDRDVYLNRRAQE